MIESISYICLIAEGLFIELDSILIAAACDRSNGYGFYAVFPC